MIPNRIALVALVLIAAAAGQPAPAEAKVRVTERTIYYTFGGRTGKELYDQMVRKGPRVERSRKVAVAQFDFALRNVKGGLRGNRCVITSADVDVKVTYRMPKWTGEGRASPKLRKAWQTFVAHLWRHEKRHTEIARDFAQDVERGLKRLRADARRDCDGMLAAAEKMMLRARARHDRRQAGFDAGWFGDGGKQFKYDRALIASE